MPGHRSFEDNDMTGKIKAQICQYSCPIDLFVAMQIDAGCDSKDCDVAGNQHAAVRRCTTGGHQMHSAAIPTHFCSQATRGWINWFGLKQMTIGCNKMERDSECREEADWKAASDEDSLLWTKSRSECREGMWWPS
jgi:hypothetical protein